MRKTVKELEKELADLKRRVERVESERVVFMPYAVPQYIPYYYPQPVFPPYPRPYGLPWGQEPYITWGTNVCGTTDDLKAATWVSNEPYRALCSDS